MGVIKINRLYKDKTSERKQLRQWESTALEKFEAKITDKEKPFPCIPATIGFTLDQLRYGFVGDPRSSTTINEVSLLFSEYTIKSKEFGNFTSLIVFYDTPQDLKATYNVEMFEKLFWNQLSGLNEKDTKDWPDDIPQDPDNPLWEFCYNGEKYFMYCASPSHQKRLSRHFDYFMLAITPRWVLQEFSKVESFANNMKGMIRKRLENYDSIQIHPDLNSYGNEDNYE
jgi:uncharacterized protein